MNPSITTDHGTTVSLDREHGETVVVLESPGAPRCTAGRLVALGDEVGFQPAPFAPWAVRPDVLRAIATLADQHGPTNLTTTTGPEGN